MNASCSLCDRPARARGLCGAHYASVKHAGHLDDIAPKRFAPCEQCGGDIPSGRRYGSVFCSVACKVTARERRKAAELAERRAKRMCAFCGAPIPLDAGGRAETCSAACGEAWRNAQKRRERRAAWDIAKKPCPECGGEIPVTRRAGTIYCSWECKHRATSRTWRERAPGYMRRYLYGVTPEQYAALLAEQGGRCAICRTDAPGGKTGAWHVDHDHATKAVRGLLCQSCNHMLGHSQDSPDRLRAAVAYLERATA